MNPNAGPLRTAKNAIIPRIPELAQKLPHTFGRRSVIRRALVDNLKEQGVDPKSFSRANFNKAERYAMIGFGIKEEVAHVVEGNGREARFRQFGSDLPKESTADFKRDLMATLDTAASHVEQLYGEGEKPENSWWNNMRRHYTWLGFKAMAAQIGPTDTTVTRESMYLNFGMRSQGILTVPRLLFPAVKNMDVAADERLIAAHDVATMPNSLAALHVLEFDASTQVDFSIVKRNERYVVAFDNKEDYNAFFPRLDNLPSARFKCPAHAPIEISGELPEVEPTKLIGESSLRNLIHAAINEAPNYNLI